MPYSRFDLILFQEKLLIFSFVPLPFCVYGKRNCLLLWQPNQEQKVHESIICNSHMQCIRMYCLKNNMLAKVFLKMPLTNSVGYMYLQSLTCHWACAEQNNRKFSQTATPPIWIPVNFKTTNVSMLLVLARVLANGIKMLILIPTNNYTQSRGRTQWLLSIPN